MILPLGHAHQLFKTCSNMDDHTSGKFLIYGTKHKQHIHLRCPKPC